MAPMKTGDNIFVYGTLKQGHGANSMMQGRSEFIRDDRITGEMYRLGGYPGVKVVGTAPAAGEPVPFVSEGPTIQGELYRITDDKLPEILDGYEGYPHLYARRRVLTEGGDTTWVYEWNGSWNDEDVRKERLVPSGNW